MRDSIDDACLAVQAAAAGKGKAAIRRMLIAELESRDACLPPPLVIDIFVDQIATGTYEAGKPFAFISAGRSGLARLPFVQKCINKLFAPKTAELESLFSAGGYIGHGVVRVTEHVASHWPLMSRLVPGPPGRELYAPAPSEVPPPARLLPDPEVRDRIPELFDPLAHPPRLPGMPPPTGADLILVWLDDDAGTVAVCCEPGRIGTLAADDTQAYLPLVRAAQIQGKAVAATADICLTAHDLLPATVRVIPGSSSPA